MQNLRAGVVSPHTHSIRIYILTRFSGDLHSLSSLSSPGSHTFLARPVALHLLQSVLWFCSLHRLVLFKAVDFIWVWQLRSGGPILSSVQFTAGIPGRWGVSEVGLGTKKADLAGSCSCQHLPEPAGKVIFGAQSPGVIGAFLCERAA